MKQEYKSLQLLQKLGITLFVAALAFFTSGIFFGDFVVTDAVLQESLNETQKTNLLEYYQSNVVGKTYGSSFSLSQAIITKYNEVNDTFKAAGEWDKVMWDNPKELSFKIAKQSGVGFFALNKGLALFLTFGLGVLGALLYIFPNFGLLGPAGIKNNGVFQHPATNRGWIGYTVFAYLVSFYITLYFFPYIIVNWTNVVDPVAELISGGQASQWFLYGFLYCTVMTVMAVRMYIKYRVLFHISSFQ